MIYTGSELLMRLWVTFAAALMVTAILRISTWFLVEKNWDALIKSGNLKGLIPKWVPILEFSLECLVNGVVILMFWKCSIKAGAGSAAILVFMNWLIQPNRKSLNRAEQRLESDRKRLKANDYIGEPTNTEFH